MAKRAIEFHPEAASEYYAALSWYRDRSIKAARQFEAEFVRAVEQVQNAPERWPTYSNDCRRFLLHQFPFQIVYQFGKDVLILAVAHTHRRPGYWKQRI
jgi:toxin ParE1/3/4